MNRKVPEYASSILYEEAENIYIRSRKNYPDISEKIIEDRKPKPGSLIFLILLMCEKYNLKIISKYLTKTIKPGKFLKDGTPARRGLVTYAFQDINTKEIYLNIVLDTSPENFKDNLEKLYNTVTNFRYLQTAKDYSLYIDGKKLSYFSGKVKHGEDEEGGVYINSAYVDKSKLESDVITKRMNIINVLIPIMYGPKSNMTIEKMICLIDKVPLARKGPLGILCINFDLHHILVILGGSLNKITNDNGDKIEPSQHLLDSNLFTNIEKIYDLMGTVKISPNAHKPRHTAIKSGGYGSEQGIETYSKDELPFCLQSEENYNEVLDYFNIPFNKREDYFSFIKRQTNENTPEDIYHPDRLIIANKTECSAA